MTTGRKIKRIERSWDEKFGAPTERQVYNSGDFLGKKYPDNEFQELGIGDDVRIYFPEKYYEEAKVIKSLIGGIYIRRGADKIDWILTQELFNMLFYCPF